MFAKLKKKEEPKDLNNYSNYITCYGDNDTDKQGIT